MSPHTHATHTIYRTEHDVTTHQHKSSNGNRPRVTLVVDLSRIRHGRGPDIPQQAAAYFFIFSCVLICHYHPATEAVKSGPAAAEGI